MDAQSDSCEPPLYDPQPPGKIRKALKLFSKRKPGSGVASIFSVRVKGEGGLKSPPTRSKTIDGLTDTVDPEAEAETVDLDQEDRHKEDAALDELTSMKNNLESTSSRQSISSLTSAKSLSFLSMLRRNRKGGEGEREAQSESHRSGQKRKGLKILLGSVRWLRKDNEVEDEILPGCPLLASRSNSVEIMKENLAITPRPARHSTDEAEFEQPPPPSQDDHIIREDTNKVSGAAKPSTNDRLSMLLGDISSILSLDSLAGGGDIVADVEAEWVKVSSRVDVDTGIGEPVQKEKAVLSPEPILSAAHSHSSTSSTIPSPTTKLIFSSIPPMSDPTTKQTLSPPSSPNLTALPKLILYNISPTTISLATKKVPSPVHSSDSSPIQSPNTIPVPITIPKSPQTTPNLTSPTKYNLTPTSPLSPEPSPKPSPPLIPTTFPDSISKAIESAALITLPTHTSIPTPKPTPTANTTPLRPILSVAQHTKHSNAPVNKYPPFITSTKPVPIAPVIRPKIVTTFGLSTSRNTAPIIKPEPKQSAHQIKAGSVQSQSEINGSESVIQMALPAEPEPPHVNKHLYAASNQPMSSATSENSTYKTELIHTSTPSGSSLLPILSTRPVNTGPYYYVPRGVKGQEEVASTKEVEEPHPASSYKIEKKTLVMKPTTVSKIPVSGGGKSKLHHKDAQSNGEERQCTLPTPVHEEETLINLSRESSIKDGLSDFSIESGGISSVLSYSSEDIVDSAAHPTMGTVSTPRESKIPMKPGSTAVYHSLQGKTEVARSKIPVSKVPVRRTNNKTGSISIATATRK